jgi:hypothetical protein
VFPTSVDRDPVAYLPQLSPRMPQPQAAKTNRLSQIPMVITQSFALLIFALAIALHSYISRPVADTHIMTQPKLNFTAQQGYFSHDSDPESWDFRATTRPRLGLQERDYPTEGDLKQILDTTQWSRFTHHVQKLNQEDPQNKRYKTFYIVRHGQGTHNVKEKEVGREEWNVRGAPLLHLQPNLPVMRGASTLTTTSAPLGQTPK